MQKVSPSFDLLSTYQHGKEQVGFTSHHVDDGQCNGMGSGRKDQNEELMEDHLQGWDGDDIVQHEYHHKEKQWAHRLGEGCVSYLRLADALCPVGGIAYTRSDNKDESFVWRRV